MEGGRGGGGEAGCLATYWAGYILPGLVTACAFRMTRPRVRVEDLLPRNFLKRKKTNKANGKPHDPSAGTEVAVNIFSKHGSSVDRNAGMELISGPPPPRPPAKKNKKNKIGDEGWVGGVTCVARMRARVCVCVFVCVRASAHVCVCVGGGGGGGE